VRAEGDAAGAAHLLAEAAAIFQDAGQPRDAARCRAGPVIIGGTISR